MSRFSTQGRTGRAVVMAVLISTVVGGALVTSSPARAARSDLTVRWNHGDVRVSDTKHLFKGENKKLFETSVAIDPLNPRNIIGFAIDLSVQNVNPEMWSVTRAYRSKNGGRTWADLGPMRYTKTGRDITQSGDPVALFDGRGNAYYASLASPRGGPGGIYVHRSIDGGATWDVPVAAVKEIEDTERDVCTGTDKEWLSADPKSGKLYLAYTLFTYECARPGLPTDSSTELSDLGIYLTTSEDEGETWTKPREIWSGYALGAMPKVGPDGTLFIGFWATVELPATACPTALGALTARTGVRPFAAIVAGSSKDGGRTWSFHHQPSCDHIAGELQKPGSFIGGSLLPSVAVDATTGVASVAYPRFMPSGNRFTIELISSDDGGESWSAPIDPTPGPADARVPALFADRGILRLAYVESTGVRDQDDQTADGTTRTLYTESSDGGQTWSEPFPLSTKIGHPREFTELGDYNTLDVARGRIVAMWTDARNGGPDGEIWARMGSIVSGGSQDGNQTVAATRLASQGTYSDAIFGGVTPLYAPSHRGLTRSAPSAPRCEDARAARLVTRALSKDRQLQASTTCAVDSSLRLLRTKAERAGYNVVFSDYEGFEGEAFAARGRRAVLLKVVQGSGSQSEISILQLK